MGTLLTAAIVVIAIVVIGIYFVMKYLATKSGGNDDVWKPEDNQGPKPEA